MHEFIAIGDLVTDAFIRLRDERIHADKKDGKYELSIPFAEKVPFEEAHILPAVGNAPNAAVSAATLGLNSYLVTNIGDDQAGQECLESLKKNNVKTDFVSITKGKKTNYHYVLWFEDDRTILIKHEDFPYILPDFGNPKWVYFSSVNKNAYPFHNKVVEYLEDKPEVKLAFQPGKFEIKLGKDKLAKLYGRSDIFFVNVSEAQTVLDTDSSDMNMLLKGLHSLGPSIVVITDGPIGAYIYDGRSSWFQPPYPDPAKPFERTGAGDAFSSTTVASLALGNDLPTALSWGAINSMSVVQQVGAQAGLLTRERVEEYLTKAPSDFQIKELG